MRSGSTRATSVRDFSASRTEEPVATRMTAIPSGAIESTTCAPASARMLARADELVPGVKVTT